MIAKIFKEESLATFDGQGIRYQIFFVGCPLRCIYCHNPDGWENGYVVEAESLVAKILRYRPYFKTFGGVTLSGGEPLMQIDFLLHFCQLLKNNRIDICLDTSASIFSEQVKALYTLIDTPIIDVKFYNQKDYEKYASFSIENLIKTLDFLLMIDKKIVARTVIIPNINDTFNDIDNYISFLRPYKKIISFYELLPFHTLGFSKYKDLNLPNFLENELALSEYKLKELQEYLITNF